MKITRIENWGSYWIIIWCFRLFYHCRFLFLYLFIFSVSNFNLEIKLNLYFKYEIFNFYNYFFKWYNINSLGLIFRLNPKDREWFIPVLQSPNLIEYSVIPFSSSTTNYFKVFFLKQWFSFPCISEKKKLYLKKWDVLEFWKFIIKKRNFNICCLN